VVWIQITRNQNKQKNKLKNTIQNEVEKHGKTIQKRKKLKRVKTYKQYKMYLIQNQVKNEWIVGSGS